MNDFVLYKHQNDFDRALKVLHASKLPSNTKKQIEDFARIRLAKGSTKLRVVKCMWCIRYMAEWLGKDFKKATKEDLIDLIMCLDSKPYAEYTKYDLKIVLKMFYKWLLGKDEDVPKIIKWLKPRLKNEKHKLPEELLTVEEVEKLANATTNARDKALILVLYESGCRIGELLYLKLKNVQFDNYGAILLVNGKTGSRRVRVIVSVQLLSLWLQEHSDKENPEAYLWPGRLGRYNGVPCSYPSVLAMLASAKKATGIRKRVHPHLFRHSRATALACKLTEAQMKEYFGWAQGSEMASTYVHLSGRDVDSTLLQMYSLKDQPVEKEVKLDVLVCPRCKERNSPTQAFCGKCGNPFDERKLLIDYNKQGNDLMNALFQDPEVTDFIAKKVIAMGLDKQLV
ncbi:tyrosine-type recombinase/integrase [Candidatus Micrarchaeota archaeon]|nr:tyrosine-type recombinase/integrase [Candidatus Micrarchaeota archaeon]